MKISSSILFYLICIFTNTGYTQLSCPETFDTLTKVYGQGKQFLSLYQPEHTFTWPEGFQTKDSILYHGEDFLAVKESRTILSYQGNDILRFPWVENFGSKYNLPLHGGFVSDSVYIFYVYTDWVNAPKNIYLLSKQKFVWKIDSLPIPQKNKGNKFEYLEIMKLTEDNQLIFRLTSGKLVEDRFEEAIVILNPVTKAYSMFGRIATGNFTSYYNR